VIEVTDKRERTEVRSTEVVIWKQVGANPYSRKQRMKFPARGQCPALRVDGRGWTECCFHGREVYRRTPPRDPYKGNEGEEMTHGGSFPKSLASH
jgi:hypothetical protein